MHDQTYKPTEFDLYGVEERDELIALVEAAEEAASDELAAFGYIADGEPSLVDELLDSLDPYTAYDETEEWAADESEAMALVYFAPEQIADYMAAYESERR